MCIPYLPYVHPLVFLQMRLVGEMSHAWALFCSESSCVIYACMCFVTNYLLNT